MTLTLGSLFSGIGGLELGLERAGMRTVWQVERDDYCRRVLAKHWPDVARFEDVRDVGAHNLPPVDVICGGFPCQDISAAGRQAGIAPGTRSGLWYEYARIIRELRPRYVIVENVAALLVRGLDVVLAELAACGYDAEWDCLPAAAFGAPHVRDRVFVVAYARPVRFDARWAEQPLPRIGLDGAHRHVADSHPQRRPQFDAAAVAARPRFHPRRAAAAGHHWEAEPGVGRVADGVPHRVDRIAALGNAIVPQVAEFIGRLIVAADAESRDEVAA